MFRKQNSSSHPLEFELVSSLDGVSPVYGASPAVGISKNGGSFLAPAGAVTKPTLDAPTGLMVTPTGMAGSTTYGYRVAALNAAGTTLAGTEVTTTTGNATLSGANHNALSWNAVAGASSYNVYGRTAGAELFLANVATSTYNDTGAASPAGALPSTGMVGADTSLKVKNLVPERRKNMRAIRTDTFDFLAKNNIKFIPSDSNCFMIDTKQPAREYMTAMAKEKVYVGRAWPSMPTWSRITVGTADEMNKFQAATMKVPS